MAAKKAGVITIDLDLGTAKFVAEMQRANTKVADFASGTRSSLRGAASEFQSLGTHGVTGVQAVSGTLRVLEGGITNNLRAAERFTANILGLGPILQAAFPIIGGIAFIGVVGKMGEEVHKFYTEIRDAPEKVAGAWRALNAPLRATNDELLVTNDRLANEIAKLEGRHQNTLKVALDEARVSADKLGDSLDKDLKGISKVLEEHDVGLMRQIVGESSTKGLKEEFGGKGGSGGYIEQLNRITASGENEIAAATTPRESNAARDRLNASLKKFYADILGQLDKQITAAENVQAGRIAPLPDTHRFRSPAGFGADVPADRFGAPATPPHADETVLLEELRAARTAVSRQSTRVDLDAANTKLQQRKTGLEAEHENAKMDRPYENRIAKMRADLDAIRTKTMSAGWSESAKAAVEGYGEAVKAIEEVNQALSRINPKLKLTDAQMGQISLAAQRLSAAKFEEAWQTKLASTSAALRDQIKNQEALTAAIGKGYAAVKAANVEAQVMANVGGERYGDPAFMKNHAADVARIRELAGADYDAKEGAVTTAAVDKLNNQIELEKSLAAVQEMGKEAVDRVILAYKLREIATNGARDAEGNLTAAVRQQIEAEIALFEAKQRTESTGGVAKIEQQISAVRRLAAAEIEGAEAARKAALENKYIEMQRSGTPPAVIAAQRTDDQTTHEGEITKLVADRVNLYKDQLDKLHEQEAELRKQIDAFGITADRARALRDIEDDQLKVLVEQDLALGSLKDGLHAFFTEMQESGKHAGRELYESLKSAVDGVSGDIAKLITGQKTSFGKTFQNIGEGLVKDSVKGAIGQGLKGLGKAFPGLAGITGALGEAVKGKPDGSKGNPLWVQMAGGGGVAGAAAGAAGKAVDGILKGNGGLLGTGEVPSSDDSNDSDDSSAAGGILQSIGKKLIGKALKGLFGFAAGGPVDGGKTIIVGEKGPELFKPSAAGHIFNNTETKQMLAARKWTASMGRPGDGSDAAPFNAPARADGGDVTAGQAYMTGERGRELYMEGSAGVGGQAAQRSDSGGGHSINIAHIDARGTDPMMVRENIRIAMQETYKASVGTGVQVNFDRARRSPSK